MFPRAATGGGCRFHMPLGNYDSIWLHLYSSNNIVSFIYNEWLIHSDQWSYMHLSQLANHDNLCWAHSLFIYVPVWRYYWRIQNEILYLVFKMKSYLYYSFIFLFFNIIILLSNYFLRPKLEFLKWDLPIERKLYHIKKN